MKEGEGRMEGREEDEERARKIKGGRKKILEGRKDEMTEGR